MPLREAARVGSKNRVVVPQEVLDTLRMKKGDFLLFEEMMREELKPGNIVIVRKGELVAK